MIEQMTNERPARRWRVAFARAGTVGLAAAVPLFLTEVAVIALREHSLAVDAANSYLPAARDLLHGRSPYHVSQVPDHTAFGSPPIAAFIFIPFLVLPAVLAEAILSILSLAAVLAALRVVGVRDWRCYAIVSLSFPAVSEFQTANLSGLLALCTAVVWRYRDRATIAGAAVAAAVALKLIGWPLIVFLLATRRFRAAAYSAGFTATAIIVPWAAVGFAGLRDYPHVLSLLEQNERRRGASITALGLHAASSPIAQLFAYLVGFALLSAAWRTHVPHRAFAASVGATLAFSPIVWAHYFVMLLVPFAIAVPRFGPLWLLPFAFWISVSSNNNPRFWQLPAILALETALLFIVCKANPGDRSRRLAAVLTDELGQRSKVAG